MPKHIPTELNPVAASPLATYVEEVEIKGHAYLRKADVVAALRAASQTYDSPNARAILNRMAASFDTAAE